MLSSPSWRSSLSPVSQAAVRGAVLLSGVFDLQPILRSSVNTALNLDREQAGRYRYCNCAGEDLYVIGY